jgi:hypothetical protein
MTRTTLRLRLVCGAGGYAPNVLQPTEVYCTNPALVSLNLQRRSTSYDVKDLNQRRVKLWARNVRSNLAYNSTSTETVGFFYIPQICDMGPAALRMLRIFLPRKNPTTSAGFQPANLGTWGQHANRSHYTKLQGINESCLPTWASFNANICPVLMREGEKQKKKQKNKKKFSNTELVFHNI